MSSQRPDPASDAAAVREATERLITAVREMRPDTLTGPSGLPGWTRGHVLAHLSRNADAQVNLLTSARTGEKIPMYASPEARERDIEEGAGRPLDEHLADLRASADRLDEAVAAMPPAAWDHVVSARGGRELPAAEIPYRRLLEVELHHLDLAIGRTAADLSPAFAARVLDWMVDRRLRVRRDLAAIRLRDTGRDLEWSLGTFGPERTVTGTTASLAAWVTGRGRGEDLTMAPRGATLPDLPPLG